jgi:signal transduction histidine kinase
MSRDMRRRLEAINRTTLRIMSGDLHERIPVTGSDDEFDQLSVNLNNMLQQIDRLLLAMREVTDNVAHDLRSPLTRLKSRLEVALLTPKSSEQYRQAIEQTVQETDNILTTFNALLSIAQAEGGAARGDMEPIDMSMLCAAVAELYEPVAETRHLSLTTALADSAPITGNRHLLSQAIANLVDNAIKYSTSGGSITLSVGVAGDAVEVVVADRGPGIPEVDRERVLQRFVRLEQSRTTPGNGLGLSLVTAVMTLHDASLVLDDNQPGLKAILRLPLAAAAAPAPARAA